MERNIAKLYYYKGYAPKSLDKPDMKDYELVCEFPYHGKAVIQLLDTMFRLFNWVDEGFQPNDPELGFNRPDTVYHTSMSVGDIVEVQGIKYICASMGWEEVEA